MKKYSVYLADCVVQSYKQLTDGNYFCQTAVDRLLEIDVNLGTSESELYVKTLAKQSTCSVNVTPMFLEQEKSLPSFNPYFYFVRLSTFVLNLQMIKKLAEPLSCSQFYRISCNSDIPNLYELQLTADANFAKSLKADPVSYPVNRGISLLFTTDWHTISLLSIGEFSQMILT